MHDASLASSLHAPAAAPDHGARLRFHVLDGQPILFDVLTQRVFRLDTASAFVWCGMADGWTAAETAARFAAAAAISKARAGRLVGEVLQRFAAVLRDAPAPERKRPPRPRLKARTGGGRRAVVLRIGTCRVLVQCPGRRIRARILASMRHLTGLRRGGRHVVLRIGRTGAGHEVRLNGRRAALVRSPAAVAPTVKALLAQLVLARSDYALAVHAAALASRRGVVLLPGVSGAGKTTLAAALHAHGFEYLGDDTIVLERGSLDVRPVPFAPAVKAGAWPLVAARDRRLYAARAELRPDLKVVRYLRPRRGRAQSRPARWIVFPAWREAGAGGLRPLDRASALKRLIALCYAPQRRLGADDLAALVAWIARCECYELGCADLDAAVRQVAALAR